MSIRVLIVDDEPLARRRISALLASQPDIDVAGECGDGAEAIAAIGSVKPDLVFLDVQMPRADGFQVLEALNSDCPPAIIFATAYDRYAIRAFEANALDYLLKPFPDDRFFKALDRARRELVSAPSDQTSKLYALLESLAPSRGHLRRLVAKDGARVVFIKTEDIDWLEACGNYLCLHVGKEQYTTRGTMNSIEPKLDPDQFVRVHRSAMVNLDRVRELGPWVRGEQALVLRDGTPVIVGRTFRDKLRRVMERMSG